MVDLKKFREQCERRTPESLREELKSLNAALAEVEGIMTTAGMDYQNDPDYKELVAAKEIVTVVGQMKTSGSYRGVI